MKIIGVDATELFNKCKRRLRGGHQDASVTCGGSRPEFAIAAIATATLNSMFLLLGKRLVAWFDWPMLVKYPVLRIALTLICANAMFAMSWMLLFFKDGLADTAIFTLIFVGTNLVPILIVAAVSCGARLIARPERLSQLLIVFSCFTLSFFSLRRCRYGPDDAITPDGTVAYR
jgi:hypothetical protein